MQSMSAALASKLFFRAADVSRALGYGNSSQAVRKNVRNKHVFTREALDGLQGVSLVETGG